MTTRENIDHDHLMATDDISEMFWTAHGDVKDQWQSEYRFEGK